MLFFLLAALTVVECVQFQQYTDGRAETCVRWDAVDVADHYRVYGRQAGTVEWVVVGEPRTDAWCPVRHLDMEVPAGVQVELAVTAVDADGRESESKSAIVGMRWPAVCVASDRAGICECFGGCP